ncbi:MAG: ATP-dependent zinc protease [Chthonomonadaceae bacterium]|nr:ATP-dependent zinc protease [Chthonomonadaceae bacterium]
MAIVIGWREVVALPDWGIDKLRAKVDTGARTSAIHVENLVEMPDGEIEFDVVMDRRHAHKHVKVRAKVKRKSHVKSSNGETLLRYFVSTSIELAGIKKEVEISLVNRDNMKVRMLVGRTALGEDFLVDAHKTNLAGGKA